MAGDDALIARLRERAADPRRRVETAPSQFDARVAGSQLGDLSSALSGVAADLDALVRSIQAAGAPPPDLVAKADDIHRKMTTPAWSALPPPLDPDALDRATAELGMTVPPFVRRLYCEVADGGFGPGAGLLPFARVVAEYRDLCEQASEIETDRWPASLLPLAASDAGHVCVDVSSGGVVESDYEERELDDGDDEMAFGLVLHERWPSVGRWLEDWLDRPDPAAERAARLDQAMVEQARESRARIAQMTPEERAAMGLPEVGWERIVWGGIGLDQEGT
jgi:hypothetical protein